MLTVYHGTASTYLPAIKKIGLQVIPINRWNADIGTFLPFNPSIIEAKDSFVYFTSDKELAKAYANLRARYLRAVSGERFKVSFLPEMVKRDGTYDRNTSPVLLTINLPDWWEAGIDYRCFGALKTTMPIPPSYIQFIEELTN